MIKLIAMDLDGTLLNADGRLHPETFEIFRGLLGRGIRLAIASGRPYPNVARLFAPVLDRLCIVCENGGLTFADGTLLDKKPIGAALLRQALRKIRIVKRRYPVFCGVHTAYVEDTEPEFLDEVHRFYPNVELCHNLEDVIGTDDICKITVWDADGAAETADPLPVVAKGLRAVRSGETWIDLGAEQATKGEGLKFLQNHYGIARAECMAFGDYYNDVDLFENAEESYAMANAPCAVKRCAKHVAPSNAAFGVVAILRQLLKA